MQIENVTVVAKTIVDLANIAAVVYGIRAVKDFLNHWLDSFPRRDQRTPVQVETDNIRSAA